MKINIHVSNYVVTSLGPQSSLQHHQEYHRSRFERLSEIPAFEGKSSHRRSQLPLQQSDTPEYILEQSRQTPNSTKLPLLFARFPRMAPADLNTSSGVSYGASTSLETRQGQGC
jgi:hypothetical protein